MLLTSRLRGSTYTCTVYIYTYIYIHIYIYYMHIYLYFPIYIYVWYKIFRISLKWGHPICQDWLSCRSPQRRRGSLRSLLSGGGIFSCGTCLNNGVSPNSLDILYRYILYTFWLFMYIMCIYIIHTYTYIFAKWGLPGGLPPFFKVAFVWMVYLGTPNKKMVGILGVSYWMVSLGFQNTWSSWILILLVYFFWNVLGSPSFKNGFLGSKSFWHPDFGFLWHGAQ